MDPRERWQALQANLSAARAALEAGEHDAALRHADAALALDPDFLAARSLRERIVSSVPSRPVAGASPAAATLPLPAAAASRPLVSKEGLARFEERARQRRIDRRLEAARQSIERGLFADARRAIDEVRELDPDHPELISLGMELDAAEHTPALQVHPGPWLAAAAVFAAIVLSATVIDESTRLVSHPSIQVAALVDLPPAEPLTVAGQTGDAAASAAETAAVGDPAERAVQVETRPSAPVAVVRDEPARAQIDPRSAPTAPPANAVPAVSNAAAPVVTAANTGAPATDALLGVNALAPVVNAAVPLGTAGSVSADVIGNVVRPADVPRVAEPSRPAPAPPVSNASNAAVATTVNDDQLVRQVLQQYRSAYETLDVNRAHAVWPAVNQAALSRAFAGLQSQNLTFDDCDVRLNGPAADAVCRGLARYVTKVGSREPRIEPRVWSFTLRKAGGDWQIETARADRGM